MGQPDAPITHAVDALAYERIVADEMSAVLEIGDLSPEADFLDNGGDSLGATVLAGKIWRALGRQLPIEEILGAGTPRAIAERLRYAPELDSILRPSFPSGQEPVPASDSQSRFWLSEEFETGPYENSCPMLWHFPGNVDLDRLSEALSIIIKRQPVLRTRLYPDVDLGLLQEVGPPTEDVLFSTDAAEEPLQLLADVARRVDIARGQPLSAAVSEGSNGSTVVAIAAHHAAFDAWSEAILVGELTRLYSNPVRTETIETGGPLPYVSYTEWHRHLVERIEEQECRYWRRQLEGVNSLPLRARPSTASAATFAARPFKIGKSTRQAIEHLASSRRLTVVPIYLSAFLAAIQIATETQDIAVGISTTGRRHPDFDQTIGCFLNTLALRPGFTAGKAPFQKHLEQMSNTLQSALAHQDCPFNRVVSTLGPSREMHPFFQCFFELQDDRGTAPVLDGRTPARLSVPWPPGTAFDFLLELRRGSDGELGGNLWYSLPAAEHSLAETIGSEFDRLVNHAASGPGESILLP